MKFKRRCFACGERAYIRVFKRDGVSFCKCPKCGAEGRFSKKINGRNIHNNRQRN